MAQKTISNLPTELVTELMTKVRGYSVLAKLSNQSAIPFNGTEQFIFNLDGNAQIVGEGEKKLGSDSNFQSKIIKPIKFVYQSRITDEFKYTTDEKRINYLQAYADGFAKKIAVAFDLAALHGLEPRTMTDATFRNTNSFDGQVTDDIVVFDATKIDDNLDTAVQAVVANGYDVNGIALSPLAGQSLAKLKVNGVVQYPEFRFGQNPESFYGMTSDINKNLVTIGGVGSTAKKDHGIVGDFQSMFKWGYAENIPMKVIEYGDPDGTGRDLQAYNEICLRTEAYIGWGILDTEAFARIEEGGA